MKIEQSRREDTGISLYPTANGYLLTFKATNAERVWDTVRAECYQDPAVVLAEIKGYLERVEAGE